MQRKVGGGSNTIILYANFSLFSGELIVHLDPLSYSLVKGDKLENQRD